VETRGGFLVTGAVAGHVRDGSVEISSTACARVGVVAAWDGLSGSVADNGTDVAPEHGHAASTLGGGHEQVSSGGV